jgi:hypothetical protein
MGGQSHFVPDDAFITYVYARNLAEGHGLRFNAADPDPVEGFSSPLHVGFAALAEAAGMDPVVSTRVLSLLAFLAVPVVAARVLVRRRRGVALLAAGVAWLPLAALPETTQHLVSGMETVLFAALAALGLVWGLRLVRAPLERAGSAAAAGALVLAALALCRPEGPLLAAGLWGATALALLAAGAPGPARPRVLLAGGLGLGLAVAALVALRLFYFGHLLPNPYYVKGPNAIFGLRPGAWPGLGETLRFFGQRYLPFAAGVALPLLLGARARPRAAVLLWLPSLGITALYARAIHEMAYGFRYEWPSLWPLSLALALALADLASRSSRRFAGAALGVAIAALAAGVALGLRPLRSPADATAWWVYRADEDPAPHARLGLDLADSGLGARATLLTGSAGKIPFLSRFFTVDWVGLNTSALSGREALGLDGVMAYIDSFAPDVFVTQLPPATPGHADRHTDPAFGAPVVQWRLRVSPLLGAWDAERSQEGVYRHMLYIRDHYAFGSAYEVPAGYWQIAYVRRDSPHAARLLEVLRGSRRSDADADLAPDYVNDPRSLPAPSPGSAAEGVVGWRPPRLPAASRRK